MKVKVLILAGIAVLINFSAINSDDRIEGLSVGDKIPGIESLGKEQDESFKNQTASCRLLNFWATYDANSRARNIRLSRIAEESGLDKIAFYSVSIDESPSVFAETVRMDRLDRSKQFHAEHGKQSKIYFKYKLKKGLSNYLINGEGVIIAKNLSPEQLKLMIDRGVL